VTQPRRIAIIGPTGSGKTTLARDLSRRLEISFIELDALRWGPNWTPRDPEELLALTRDELAKAPDGWVVDGNYRQVRDLVFPRADTIIWLNYPLTFIYRQLFARTIRRVARKERLFNGNVETWREQFLSTDSLFRYAVRHKIRQRKAYPRLLADPEYAHATKLVFRSPYHCGRWLERLSRSRRDEGRTQTSADQVT